MRRTAVLAAGAFALSLAACGWVEKSREATKHNAAGLQAVEAAERGNVEELKAVLAKDPESANGKRWTPGKRRGQMRSLTDTALTAAVRARSLPALELLLSSGADPNVALDSGDAPLEVLAAGKWRDDTALALAKALVAGGARLAPRKVQGAGGTWSPLHALLANGALGDGDDRLLRLFASDPAAVRATDLRGRAPLHVAARACDERPVEALIESGADPNVRGVSAADAFPTDRAGDTPLHDATACTSLGTVFALCAGGANPQLKNEAGETPLVSFRRMTTPEREKQDTETMRRSRASMAAALSPGGPCEEWYGRFLRGGRPASWDAVHAARYEFACGFDERFDCGQSGWAHQKGEGVAVDFGKAMAAYRKACALKSAWACGMVGSLYDNGEGVAEDPAEAARWYATGCDGDDGQSCYRLGALARDGRGVAQHRARALALFEKACARKYEKGCEGARALR